MPLRIALIDDSRLFDGADLHKLVAPLEANLVECWRVWRHHLHPSFADGEPSVWAWPKGEPLPRWSGLNGGPAHMAPVYITDVHSKGETYLGVHYVAGDRPAASVFGDKGSGKYTGHQSVAETLAHELMELLVNPYLDEWVRIPGRDAWTPLEVADMLQTHHPVDMGQGPVPVANFSYPAHFGLANGPDTPAGQMDHYGVVSEPFELAPSGYRMTRRSDWTGLDYEWGAARDGFNARQARDQMRPLARTRRLIEVCNKRCRGYAMQAMAT